MVACQLLMLNKQESLVDDIGASQVASVIRNCAGSTRKLGPLTASQPVKLCTHSLSEYKAELSGWAE
jgi:hypothetical protein